MLPFYKRSFFCAFILLCGLYERIVWVQAYCAACIWLIFICSRLKPSSLVGAPRNVWSHLALMPLGHERKLVAIWPMFGRFTHSPSDLYSCWPSCHCGHSDNSFTSFTNILGRSDEAAPFCTNTSLIVLYPLTTTTNVFPK